MPLGHRSEAPGSACWSIRNLRRSLRLQISAALALFSVATVISFHSNFADQNQMIHFLKNVMMAGGLLQIAAFGGGVLSVDSRLSKGRGTVASAAPAH